MSVHLLPAKVNLQVATFLSFSLTFNRISGQSQLADDVTRNVSLHQVTLFGVVLCCLQQMVELLRIKLLEKRALKFECNIIGWKVLEIVHSHRPHDIKLDLLWDDWIFGWETDLNPNRKITPLSLQQHHAVVLFSWSREFFFLTDDSFSLVG